MSVSRCLRVTWAVAAYALLCASGVSIEDRIQEYNQTHQPAPRRALLWCKSMAAKYTVDEMRKGYYYPRDLTDFDSNERVVEDRQLRDSWRATCENGPTSQELIREGFEAAGDELVHPYPCDEKKDQEWTVTSVAPTSSATSLLTVQIENKANKMCLDFSGYVGEVGVSAGLYPCRDTGSQQWGIEPDGTGLVQHLMSKLCLGLDGRLQACDVPQVQKWSIDRWKPGILGVTSTIRSAKSAQNLKCLSSKRTPKPPITYVGWGKVSDRRCMRSVVTPNLWSFAACAKSCHDTANCYAISWEKDHPVCRWSTLADCLPGLGQEESTQFDIFVNHGFWNSEVRSSEASCAVACLIGTNSTPASECVRANKGAHLMGCYQHGNGQTCYCRDPEKIPVGKWSAIIVKSTVHSNHWSAGKCLTYVEQNQPLTVEECKQEHGQVWRVTQDGLIENAKRLEHYVMAVDSGSAQQIKLLANSTGRAKKLQQWRFGQQGTIRSAYFSDQNMTDVCLTSAKSVTQQKCKGKGPTGQHWRVEVLKPDAFVFQPGNTTFIWYVMNGVKHRVRECKPCGLRRNVCETAAPVTGQWLESLTTGQPYRCDTHLKEATDNWSKNRHDYKLALLDQKSNRRRTANKFFHPGFRTGLRSFTLTPTDREMMKNSMYLYRTFVNESLVESQETKEQLQAQKNADNDNKVDLVQSLIHTGDADFRKEISQKLGHEKPVAWTTHHIRDKLKVPKHFAVGLIPVVKLAERADWRRVETAFNSGLMGEMVNLGFLFYQEIFNARSSVISAKHPLRDRLNIKDFQQNYLVDPDAYDTAYWELSNFPERDGSAARVIFEAKMFLCSTCNCPGGKLVDGHVYSQQMQRPSTASKYRLVKMQVDSWAAQRMSSVHQALDSFLWSKLAEKILGGCSATNADKRLERTQKYYLRRTREGVAERAEKHKRHEAFMAGLPQEFPLEAEPMPMTAAEVKYKSKINKTKSEEAYRKSAERDAKEAAQAELEAEEHRAQDEYFAQQKARIAENKEKKEEAAELKARNDKKIEEGVELAQFRLASLKKKASEQEKKFEVISKKLYDTPKQKKHAIDQAVTRKKQIALNISKAELDVVGAKDALQRLKRERIKQRHESAYKEEKSKRREIILDDTRRLGESISTPHNGQLPSLFDAYGSYSLGVATTSEAIKHPLSMSANFEMLRRDSMRPGLSPKSHVQPKSKSSSRPASVLTTDRRLLDKLVNAGKSMATSTNDTLVEQQSSSTSLLLWTISSPDNACRLLAKVSAKTCPSCEACNNEYVDSELTTKLIASQKHVGIPDSANTEFRESVPQQSCEVWLLMWRARLAGMLIDVRSDFMQRKVHHCEACQAVDKQLANGVHYFADPVTERFSSANKENIMFYDLCKAQNGRSIPAGCCAARSYKLGYLEKYNHRFSGSNTNTISAHSQHKDTALSTVSNSSEIFAPSNASAWRSQEHGITSLPGSRCILTKHGVECDPDKITQYAEEDDTIQFGTMLQKKLQDKKSEAEVDQEQKTLTALNAVSKLTKRQKAAFDSQRGQLQSLHLQVSRVKREIAQAKHHGNVMALGLAQAKQARLDQHIAWTKSLVRSTGAAYQDAKLDRTDIGMKVIKQLEPKRSTKEKERLETRARVRQNQAKKSKLERLKKTLKWKNTALNEIPQDVISRIALRRPLIPTEKATYPPPVKRVKHPRENIPVRRKPKSRFPHKEAEIKYEERREDEQKAFRERMSKHQLKAHREPSVKASSPVSLDGMSQHEFQEVRFKASIRASINGYEITCKSPCLCTPTKMAYISKEKSQMMHDELSESRSMNTTKSQQTNHVYGKDVKNHLPFFRPSTARLRLKKAQELKYKRHASTQEHDWTYAQRNSRAHKIVNRRSCLCCKAPTSRIYRVGHNMALP